MAVDKRMAVTLPAGPSLEQTIKRLEWAEDNGFPQPFLPVTLQVGFEKCGQRSFIEFVCLTYGCELNVTLVIHVA